MKTVAGHCLVVSVTTLAVGAMVGLTRGYEAQGMALVNLSALVFGVASLLFLVAWKKGL